MTGYRHKETHVLHVAHAVHAGLAPSGHDGAISTLYTQVKHVICLPLSADTSAGAAQHRVLREQHAPVVIVTKLQYNLAGCMAMRV